MAGKKALVSLFHVVNELVADNRKLYRSYYF